MRRAAWSAELGRDKRVRYSVLVVGRGSDRRRARSVSANLRQFSHRSMELLVIELRQITG